MYCLQSVGSAPYIYGWEDDLFINNAILAIPPNSGLLAALRKMFLDPNFVAPWLSFPRKFKYRLAAGMGRPVTRARYPWGMLGPKALTWYIREQQLLSHARPAEYFYPVHYTDIDSFFDASVDWNAGALGQARTVHIWNEKLRSHPELSSPPAGSFLWKLLKGIPLCGK
jgi:hypothetical protein